MKSKYSIVIYNNFHNELTTHWKRIQEDSEIHPQMYFEWCKTWWKFKAEKRKLHVVAVKNDERIVGIAPLCIEKMFGISVLRSFPVRFGDFYSFVIENGKNLYKITDEILNYLKTFNLWQIIYLSKISMRNPLFDVLSNNDFKQKLLSRIHIADLENKRFKNYLSNLSRGTRKTYNNRLRRINEIGELEFECTTDLKVYLDNLDSMQAIYRSRWTDDFTNTPSNEYYLMEREAVEELHKSKKVLLSLLKLNNEIIAYRWGFIHNNVYYAWRVSHSPNYDKYYPGILLIGKIIEELIGRKYKAVNFGAGDYKWKASWANPENESAIYDMFYAGNSLTAKLYIKYRLKWRDKIKTTYRKALKMAWVRQINRKIRKSK